MTLSSVLLNFTRIVVSKFFLESFTSFFYTDSDISGLYFTVVTVDLNFYYKVNGINPEYENQQEKTKPLPEYNSVSTMERDR